MKNIKVHVLIYIACLALYPSISGAGILFQEEFEDTNFASRGWYDNTSLNLSTVEHIPNSNSSVEFRFLQSAQQPTTGGSIRMKFTATDEVYVSYWVKYSANWDGSNKSYHPHEFFIMTNVDNDYLGPAYSHLTAYIEQNEGEPLLAIQDGTNIDEGNININLTSVSENRAVAGCNGDGDGYGNGSCYLVGSNHWNWKQWKAGSFYFQDTPGSYYKNDWHLVEAYFKLNTIDGSGKGLADGILQYWFDGVLIIDHNNVMMRTGQHPNMKFDKLLIAPWIGDGSPVDQIMWVDHLTMATTRVTDTVAPAPPTNLQAN